MRKILIYGNPLLKQNSAPLESATPPLQGFINEMAQILYHSNEGVGLAAPQVGELIRALVVDVDHIATEKNPNPRRHLQVFLNPEIVSESEEDSVYTEGCLSVPGVEGKIYRPALVVVRYRDLDFKEHEIQADGFLARVLQHEIDHLNGTLFVDRLSFTQRALIAGKLHKLRRNTAHHITPEASKKHKAPLI